VPRFPHSGERSYTAVSSPVLSAKHSVWTPSRCRIVTQRFDKGSERLTRTSRPESSLSSFAARSSRLKFKAKCSTASSWNRPPVSRTLVRKCDQKQDQSNLLA
jgi:hypothetical protein